MARFDDARNSPAARVDESFSYLGMVTLTILGQRQACPPRLEVPSLAPSGVGTVGASGP